MRIAVTSDIHIDHNGSQVLDALAARVRMIAPDVLVVAGDIATGAATFLQTLLTLRATAAEMVIVAGNHDVWSAPSAVAAGIDAWVRLDGLLPALAREAGVHDLDAGPVEIGGLGFAGTLGWYDLTMRDTELELSDEVYLSGVYGGFRWVDHQLAVWGDGAGGRLSMGEVCRRLRERFAAHLAALPTERIVAVTHTLPFQGQVHRKEHPGWRFVNAFMGSTHLGDVIRADRRVVLAVAGHTHIGSERTEGGLHALVSPLGYRREWNGAPIDVVVERALRVVEV